MPVRQMALLGAAVVLSFQVPPAATAMGCGCCVEADPFSQDAARARLVLVGKFTAARKGPGEGSTDFVIDQVLKGDAMVAVRGNVLRVPRYIASVDEVKPRTLLVCGSVVEGKFDPDRGVPATQAWVKYVGGLVKIDPKDRPALLRHCFDYLRHEDQNLAGDAHRMFARSSDTDLQKVARMLRPDELRRRLQDEKEQPHRLELFSSLLGSCGNAKDASLLRKVLDKGMKQEGPPRSLDGVLTGYTLLSPKDGWAYTRDLLKDPQRDFTVRYLGLRAVDYFYTTRPGVVADNDLIEGVGLLLEQSDIADVAIDHLRRWNCWEHTQRILNLNTKDDSEGRLIRRYIVRYALDCPDAKAARFVAHLRLVKDPVLAAVEE